jgi:hypothetical protein
LIPGGTLLGAPSADGSLPPLPYHYLHPPTALKGTNSRPESGKATDPVVSGRSKVAYVFTVDGQAGITVGSGGFAVSRSTRGVAIAIQPVETPAGLPSQVVPDGNAYAITAVAQPENKPTQLAYRVKLSLQWPHFPIGIYVYRNARWRLLCAANGTTLSSTRIACRTSALGTFVAVTTPSNAGVQAPNTPASGLNPYIPVLAAIGVVIVAAILAFFVARADKRSTQ